MLSCGLQRKRFPCLFCFCWLPGSLVTHWRIDASLESQPPLSHVLSMCVSVSRLPSSHKDVKHCIRHTPIQHDLILTWLLLQRS
jgi:hypothetical protein